MSDRDRERDWMVETQIVVRGVRDRRVLAAMRRLPRELFVPADTADLAYADAALPIGHGQTISQPYTVAAMLEAATLRPTDRVLEIGTGSGYAAALLAALARQVLTIEISEPLALAARDRLTSLGLSNVDVRRGDGSRGDPDGAPYEAILVAARADDVPGALLDQLAPGGRLVLPVGRQGRERLVKLTRRDGRFEDTDLGAFSFVPLVCGTTR